MSGSKSKRSLLLSPAERLIPIVTEPPATGFRARSLALAVAFITLLSFPAARGQAVGAVQVDSARHPVVNIIPEPIPERRQKKSSLKAVGLSAILPGAGQVYTEQYWKVPVILGLGGYWVYEWVQNHDRYKEFRDLYSASLVSSPPQGDTEFLSLREFYKDQRDSFAWYIGLLYLLNVVDAFVDAELYDFDVGPDLTHGHSGMYASVRFRF